MRSLTLVPRNVFCRGPHLATLRVENLVLFIKARLQYQPFLCAGSEVMRAAFYTNKGPLLMSLQFVITDPIAIEKKLRTFVISCRAKDISLVRRLGGNRKQEGNEPFRHSGVGDHRVTQRRVG